MAASVTERILKDLAVLVNTGLDQGYAKLRILPELKATRERLRSSTPAGLRASVRRLVEDALEELRGTSPEYASAAQELLQLGPKTVTASVRREVAGKWLGKSGPTFRRHYESLVLGAVADSILLIEDLGAGADEDAPKVVDVGWEPIQTTLRAMHREIEQRFEPDVVLTMSGPGSFAAFLCLSMNPRDVPVVACTTFPRRDRPSPPHQIFATAARESTWHVAETSKWVVYLPAVIGSFPPKTRVLVFDDRVISGDTQREVRTLLERSGYVVQTAAMIVGSKAKSLVEFHGLVIDDEYLLPWGTRRGRT